MVVLLLVFDSHSDRCEVLYHCGFGLYFSDHYLCCASFHVPLGYLHFLFEKMAVYIHWIFTPYQECQLQRFSSIQ